MAKEKDKREDFIISNLLERIISSGKKLDRLIIIYLSIILFEGLQFDLKFFSVSNILEHISISLGKTLYTIVISISLLLVFGLIGSKLIEYILKREILDNMLMIDNTNEERLRISSTIIPSSFYEYLYTLVIYSKVRTDNLRHTAVYCLFAVFLSGHCFSFILITGLDMNLYVKTIFMIFYSTALLSLYFTFIKSVKRVQNELGKRLRKYVLVLTIIFTALFILAVILSYK